MTLLDDDKPNVSNHDYFTALLNAGVILLPFTVDPHGGLGYHAHRFLYHTTKPAPPKPPSTWITNLSPHAHAAYTQLLSAPTGLLPKADKNYIAANPHSTQPRPSQWATYTLALNLSTALADHINRATTFARTHHHCSMQDPPQPLGHTYLYATAPALLNPLPTFLHLDSPALQAL